MWSSGNVGVDCNRLSGVSRRLRGVAFVQDVLTYEDELVILSIEVVEVISPQILCVSRVHETMTVWRGLDEHVWWKVLSHGISGCCILKIDFALTSRYQFAGISTSPVS